MNPRKRNHVWTTQLAGFSISLYQLGVDRFEVVYGLQVRTELTYEQASAEVGQAIFHALSCEGKLDNRNPGEDD